MHGLEVRPTSRRRAAMRSRVPPRKRPWDERAANATDLYAPLLLSSNAAKGS